jgi:diguanylate cyclase (GGDEF)-like protein/PAS domain S-box-containing protein
MIEFQESNGHKKPAYIVKGKEFNLAYPESQNMFRRLVERGHVGIFMADSKGFLFYVNQALVTMLGYVTKDDIWGKNLADILFKDREVRAEFLKQINEKGSVRDCELKVIRPDGLETILSVTGNFLEDKDGELVGLDGIVHNVTEKNHLEEALLIEKQKLEQLLEFDEAIGSIKEFDELVDCVVDRSSKILEVMKCSLMVLDDQTKTLTIAGARGLSDQTVRETKEKLGEMIAGVVAQEGQPLLVKNIEYDRKFQRANRTSYLGRSFMIVPIKLGERVVGVINVADKILKDSPSKAAKLNFERTFTDVDLRILSAIGREVSVAFENVKLYKELSSLAVTDPLTHIYNYRQFAKSLDYELKRCHRNNIPLCVILIDIDGFKAYNDDFGRSEGDALLKNLGQILQGQLREVDIVCRYAGDEFAVILPDTDLEGAQRAGQKIRNAVARCSFKREVTLSCGIASHAGEMSQYQLIHNANKALDRAKREGKNRICFFE